MSNRGSVLSVGIYSVRSAAPLRVWTSVKDLPLTMVEQTLSWLPGGRLAFTVTPKGDPYGNQLRTLDPSASGTSLLAASRALLTVRSAGPGELGVITNGRLRPFKLPKGLPPNYGIVAF